ncbi:MAG TPA: EAL domain-containing protein [Solirubrobacteraceae bacterium]|nr:EAL domain-containing protein [Solirubrobacteraceae bacterium]
MSATTSSPPPPLEGNLLAAMFESLQDYAILMLDVDGHIASWNVGADRFKGWDAGEIVGRSHALFYLEEDIASGRPGSDLSMAAEYGRFEEQHWRIRKDGSRFWASVVITAVRDSRGELRGFGEVIRDVTDHYAAIQALRRSESRFRSVTESAIDAIFAFNADLRIISWNAAAARLYGYTAAEAIGQSVFTLVPEFRREDVEALITVAAASDRAEQVAIKPVEGIALRVDGRLVPVEVALSSWRIGSERNFSAIVRDITDRKRHERELQQLADHDPITNLFNRRRFEQELDRIVSECDRYDRTAALLVLDLDGFKEVNDLHGHAAGDEILVKVGALLQATVRDSDVVGRIGGDEFGVIVQEADRAEAECVAQKVVAAVRSSGMVISDVVRAQVTASVGIAVIEPRVEVTAEELRIGADRAMYRAKAEGRPGYAFMVPDDDAGAVLAARRSWISRLRDSLENDLFELHAQPIVTINGDGIPRYELLLRMRDDDDQLLAPSAFLDNAERFDLIGGIDRWVLSRAVTMLHDRHRAGHDINLTVNLSGKTMNDESIVGDLAQMLETHPIPPGALIVEVTETAAIVNIERAAALARELRALGCHFALDDFGSGFSSFYYLKHLEFDYLKIDGEFVANLVASPSDQLVVRAVVDIARGMGSRTIAEFVGDDETVALLQDIGVDYGQGFHLGRPGPLKQLAA